MILNEEELKLLAKMHPDLDISFVDGYRKEIAVLLKAQLKQVVEWLIDLLVDEGYLQGREILETRRPTHGTCCTCQDCGHEHLECICDHNRLLQALLDEVK